MWLCLALVLTHLGLALLVTLTSGWPRHPRERAPEIDRNPVEPFARTFIFVFALAPALMAIAVAFASGRLGPLDRVAPRVTYRNPHDDFRRIGWLATHSGNSVPRAQAFDERFVEFETGLPHPLEDHRTAGFGFGQAIAPVDQ